MRHLPTDVPFRRLPIVHLADDELPLNAFELNELRSYFQEQLDIVNRSAARTPQASTLMESRGEVNVIQGDEEIGESAQNEEEEKSLEDDGDFQMEETSPEEEVRTRKIVNIIRAKRVLAIQNDEAFNELEDFIDKDFPKSWYEMVTASDAPKWIEAASKEFKALLENGTYVLVPREAAKGQKVLNCRWVCTKKEKKDGEVYYKARCVVKGYMQNYGVDYLETYAPVIRFETLRTVLIVAMAFKYDVHQIDFDTAFLNATLPNEYKIVMEQPTGFVHPQYPEFVCLLKKSLYGLKQAPKEWNSMLHQYLTENGFSRNLKDYGLYFKHDEMEIILVAVYVDDVLIIGPSEMVKNFIEQLKSILK